MILSNKKRVGRNSDIAEVAELADAQDSKSCDRKVMRVQVPPSAQEKLHTEFFVYTKNNTAFIDKQQINSHNAFVL